MIYGEALDFLLSGNTFQNIMGEFPQMKDQLGVPLLKVKRKVRYSHTLEYFSLKSAAKQICAFEPQAVALHESAA